MAILEVKGAFQVVLPERWSVSGVPGKTYDLVPPDGQELAVTITLYPRPSKKETGTAGSEGALRSFVDHLGVEDSQTLSIQTVESRGQQRSFAKVRSSDLDWFVGCLFFKRVFILATANGSHEDADSLEVGEAIVASIAPF